MKIRKAVKVSGLIVFLEDEEPLLLLKHDTANFGKGMVTMYRASDDGWIALGREEIAAIHKELEAYLAEKGGDHA